MTIYFQTFGCRVNQAEEDIFRRRLTALGYKPAESAAKADLVIVNACSVTAKAEQKTRRYMRRLRQRPDRPVIFLTGCYLIPQAATNLWDEYIPNNRKDELPELLDKRYPPRESAAPPHTAAARRTRLPLKVQDGCDEYCSYCIIPYLRPDPVSVPLNHVIQTARKRIEEGVYELILTGINLGKYADGAKRLRDLVAALLELKGLGRLRLSSIEPPYVSSEIVALYRHPKLCRHIHIPMQSGSPQILRRMNRSDCREKIGELIKHLKHQHPSMSVGTDLIIGFPGETREDMDASLELLSMGFNAFHLFPYSKRRGTKAASMRHHVDASVIKQRFHEAVKLTSSRRKNYLENLIGRTVEVVLERPITSTLWRGTASELVPVCVSGIPEPTAMVRARVKSADEQSCLQADVIK